MRGIKTISALVTDIIVGHLNQRDPDVLARAKVLEGGQASIAGGAPD